MSSGLVNNTDQDLVTHVIGYMSDDKLRDIAFRTFLKAAMDILSDDANNIIDLLVGQRANSVVQVMWELLQTSNHFLKQKFANYLGEESRLVKIILESNLQLSTSLECPGKL